MRFSTVRDAWDSYQKTMLSLATPTTVSNHRKTYYAAALQTYSMVMRFALSSAETPEQAATHMEVLEAEFEAFLNELAHDNT